MSAISRSASACPSGCAISSVTERLLRFTPTKYALSLVSGHVRRREAARVVAGARPLDLDHVGAEIGQHLHAGRPRQHAGQVEHAQALQRAGGFASCFSPLARGSHSGPYGVPLISRPPATANRARNRLEETPAMPDSGTMLRPGESIEGRALLDRRLPHPGGAVRSATARRCWWWSG